MEGEKWEGAERERFKTWWTKERQPGPVAINDLYDAGDLLNYARMRAEQAWMERARRDEARQRAERMRERLDSVEAAIRALSELKERVMVGEVEIGDFYQVAWNSTPTAADVASLAVASDEEFQRSVEQHDPPNRWCGDCFSYPCRCGSTGEPEAPGSCSGERGEVGGEGR